MSNILSANNLHKVLEENKKAMSDIDLRYRIGLKAAALNIKPKIKEENNNNNNNNNTSCASATEVKSASTSNNELPSFAVIEQWKNGRYAPLKEDNRRPQRLTKSASAKNEIPNWKLIDEFHSKGGIVASDEVGDNGNGNNWITINQFKEGKIEGNISSNIKSASEEINDDDDYELFKVPLNTTIPSYLITRRHLGLEE